MPINDAELLDSIAEAAEEERKLEVQIQNLDDRVHVALENRDNAITAHVEVSITASDPVLTRGYALEAINEWRRATDAITEAREKCELVRTIRHEAERELIGVARDQNWV